MCGDDRAAAGMNRYLAAINLDIEVFPVLSYRCSGIFDLLPAPVYHIIRGVQ